MNIGFHLFYWILSLAPLSQLIWLKNHSIAKEFANRAFTAMSYFIIALCLIIAFSIIRQVIIAKEFHLLIGLALVPGIFLGALRLNLELRGKK